MDVACVGVEICDRSVVLPCVEHDQIEQVADGE